MTTDIATRIAKLNETKAAVFASIAESVEKIEAMSARNNWLGATKFARRMMDTFGGEMTADQKRRMQAVLAKWSYLTK